jgi:hypothetical protein
MTDISRHLESVRCTGCGKLAEHRTWSPRRGAFICDACHPAPSCRFRHAEEYAMTPTPSHVAARTGMVPVQPKRPKNRREIKFAMIDMQAMPKLKMSKGEWSLFWLVVSYTDLERGEARIATGELSKELGWAGPNTSRALSRLAERNILIKEGPGVWRANPRLLARGTVDKWELHMADAPAVDWDGE